MNTLYNIKLSNGEILDDHICPQTGHHTSVESHETDAMYLLFKFCQIRKKKFFQRSHSESGEPHNFLSSNAKNHVKNDKVLCKFIFHNSSFDSFITLIAYTALRLQQVAGQHCLLQLMPANFNSYISKFSTGDFANKWNKFIVII